MIFKSAEKHKCNMTATHDCKRCATWLLHSEHFSARYRQTNHCFAWERLCSLLRTSTKRTLNTYTNQKLCLLHNSVESATSFGRALHGNSDACYSFGRWPPSSGRTRKRHSGRQICCKLSSHYMCVIRCCDMAVNKARGSNILNDLFPFWAK